jgi:hypothetical protein
MTDQNTVQRGMKPLTAYLPEFVLISDVLIAFVVWMMRDTLFGAGNDMIAGIVAGMLISGGVVAAFVLKMQMKKINSQNQSKE